MKEIKGYVKIKDISNVTGFDAITVSKEISRIFQERPKWARGNCILIPESVANLIVRELCARACTEPVARLKPRRAIYDIVFKSMETHGQTMKEMYDMVYKEFYKIHRVDIKSQAKKAEIHPMDYAEKKGYLDNMLLIAERII